MVAKRKSLVKKLAPPLILVAVVVATIWYQLDKRRPKDLVLSGTVEARTVMVGPLYGGRVAKVLVDEGSVVKKDQVLAILESDPIDDQIAEQRSLIAAARASLLRTERGPRSEEIERAATLYAGYERERQRFAELYRQGVVSKQDYDAKTVAARVALQELRILQSGSRSEDIAAARAELQRQERRLATLETQRADSNIVSSVDGVVQSFALRPGDIVAAGQGVVEILENDQLWVRVFVPETLLGLVQLGTPATIRVDTFPSKTYRGTVSQISSQAEYTPRNVQTRDQRADQLFGVRITIDRTPDLKSGMAAEVDLGVKGNAS